MLSTQLSGFDIILLMVSYIKFKYINRSGYIMKLNFFLFVCEFILFASIPISAEFGEVRLVHMQWGLDRDLPEPLLKRIKEAGYTHVSVEYWLSRKPFIDDWDGKGNLLRDTTTLQKRFSKLFLQLDKYDLKFIPMFTTDDVFSQHLFHFDNRLEFQNAPIDIPDREKWIKKRTPSHSPDDQILNDIIENILDITFSAFEAIKNFLSYDDMDYFFASIDEVVHRWGKDKPRSYMVVGGFCDQDKKWISEKLKSDMSEEEKLCSLFGNLIEKRVSQLDEMNQKYSTSTKLLMFGNMFDPEHYGGYDKIYMLKNFSNQFSENKKVNVKLFNTLGLPLMQSIRDDIVFVLWQYTNHFENNFYDVKKSSQYFSDNGFQFMHMFAGAEYNSKATKLQPIHKGRIDHIKLKSKIIRENEFNGYSLGYGIANWNDLYYIFIQDSVEWNNGSNYARPFDMIEILNQNIHIKK